MSDLLCLGPAKPPKMKAAFVVAENRYLQIEAV
jgi:hypothetical protein